MKENKKVKISTILYALAVIIIGLIVVFGISIYGFGADNKLVRGVENIFPYPAAVIDGVHFLTIRELQNNVDAVRKFYENQDFSKLGIKVDFNSEDGKKMLRIKERDSLVKMIENKIIEIAANKKGIKITDAMISEEIAGKRSQSGTADGLENNLKNLYGWTIDDFKEKIVKPDMYKKALAADMQNNDTAWISAKKKIDQAKADLDGKKDFASVATSVSEGDSAKQGGELGWFSYDQMLPEIASVALTADVNKPSEIIKSSLGYHIIKVEDRKTENGVEKVKLSQIFVRAKTFSDWLLEQEKNAKITVLMKGMTWNNDGGIDFTESDMKTFEENANKDTSLDVAPGQLINN